jgi:hypothetical protein
MKRRDFLEASSAAATTPLFLEDFDINLDSLLGDGGLGGLGGIFGEPESAPGKPTDPVAERIDHPVPELSVSVSETNGSGGYIADIDVTDAKEWDTVFVFATDADSGGGPINTDLGETQKTFPTDSVVDREYFDAETMLVFEAVQSGNYRGVFFARFSVDDGSGTLTPAHEVPTEFCWEPGISGCNIDDPVQPDVETPKDEG